MKSPWKYLFQLVSGDRTVKEAERLLEIGPAKPVGDVVAPIVEISKEVTVNLDATIIESVVVPASQGERTPIETVDRANAADHAILPRPLPAKRLRRSRKATSAVAAGYAVEYGRGGSSVAPPPITLFDEMTALDEDIRRLRHQLAEKLLLQNTQLKKMLERYDVS